MKKTIITLGCLTIFASGWAFGQTKAKSFNGTFWKSLGSDTLANEVKAMYIEGFRNGFMRGYFDGIVRASNVGSERTPAEEKRALSFLSQDNPLISTFTTKHSDFSNGEVVSEMNDFYNDYRNVAVCWDDALIFSLQSLEGHPPTQLQLDKARVKGAKSSSCTSVFPSP